MSALAESRVYSYTHCRQFTRDHPKRGQMTWKERDKFGPLCCEWLESIGAGVGTSYDFEVFTRYGVLQITPYDNWIACRFNEVSRAAPIIGHSFSGKWNHHWFDVQPADSHPTAAELLQLFQDRLSAVL